MLEKMCKKCAKSVRSFVQKMCKVKKVQKMCYKKRCKKCGKLRRIKWKIPIGRVGDLIIWEQVCWDCKRSYNP